MFKKLLYITGLVVIAMFVSGCAVANSSAGGVVSVNKSQIYASPDTDETLTINASPVLLTGLTVGRRHQVISVNGKTAWIERPNAILAKVMLKSRVMPLELTANSTESNPDAEHKWLSIDQELRWRLNGATRNTYAFTPAYIKDQGRINLLAEQWSPYQMPEVELISNDISGWAGLLDLDITADKKLDQSLFYGVVIKPFIGMLNIDAQKLLPRIPITIKNMSYPEPQMTRLSSMSWQLESLLVIPPNSNSNVNVVALASDISQQSYLLTILWRSGQVTYVGFSGAANNTVERIPTPVLVDYKIVDINNDGIDDVSLVVGQITGDDAYLETIHVNGKYSSNSDGIKLYE